MKSNNFDINDFRNLGPETCEMCGDDCLSIQDVGILYADDTYYVKPVSFGNVLKKISKRERVSFRGTGFWVDYICRSGCSYRVVTGSHKGNLFRSLAQELENER